MEEVARAWVKDVLDLPRTAAFAFTTGCQMVHFTCLAAARHALLRDRGWNVDRDGLNGAPPSGYSRPSTGTAASNARCGSSRSVRPRSSPLRPMRMSVTVDVVAAALQASDAPTIVHLDAADPNVGAIDPFAALVPIACAAGALVHVDGAFDLWAPEQPASRQDGRGRVGALLGGGRAQMAQNAQGYRDGGDRRSRSAPGGNDDQRGLHRA